MFNFGSGIARQKPVIDSAAVVSWPFFNTNAVSISNDGNFFSYIVDNSPVGSQTLIIHKIDDTWKKEILSASSCFFTNDSKQAIYQSNDTLQFLSLKSKQLAYICNISAFKQPQLDKGSGSLIN